MKKRTGLLGLGVLLSAGALTVSCGDDTSNGNGANGTGGSTAGAAGAGSPMAGNSSGGVNNNGGNGTAGSVNGGTDSAGGADAAGGDGSMAGSGNPSGGDGSMAGAGNPNGGMPGTDGGAPAAGAPGVDGGAGGAAPFNECPNATDGQPCFRPGGGQNACTNDDGAVCLCQRVNQQSQDREWNCFGGNPGAGGAGGAAPGFVADCGQNPVDNGDCTGFGQCEGAPTCFCFQTNVFCQ